METRNFLNGDTASVLRDILNASDGEPTELKVGEGVFRPDPSGLSTPEGAITDTVVVRGTYTEEGGPARAAEFTIPVDSTTALSFDQLRFPEDQAA